jgi:hypothetical protein
MYKYNLSRINDIEILIITSLTGIKKKYDTNINIRRIKWRKGKEGLIPFRARVIREINK